MKAIRSKEGCKVPNLEGFHLVSSFAESRNVDRNAITQYIRRHPDLFEGHTIVESQRMYFDDAAMEFLDKQYPLPSPVEVIPDTKSRELLLAEQQKTIMLQDELMKLKDQLHESQLKLAKQENNILLLEDRSKRMESENTEMKEKIEQQAQKIAETSTSLDFIEKERDAASDRAEEQKALKEAAEREIEELKARAEAAEQQVNNMKKASFWERLRGWK